MQQKTGVGSPDPYPRSKIVTLLSQSKIECVLVVLYHQRVEVRLVLRNLKHPAIRIRLLIQETAESDVEV